MKQFFRNTLFVVVLTLAVSMVYQLTYAEDEEVEDSNWSIPILVSGNGFGDRPTIKRAPNGDMMIIYNRWSPNADHNEPYYSELKSGNSVWSAASRINFAVNAESSTNTYFAYDSQSVAHAVWAETQQTPFVSWVRYARKAPNGAWVGQTLYTDTNGLAPVEQARIAVGPNNNLHVVWDAADFTGNIIYYRRSTNGGVSWSNNQMIDVGGGRLPDVVVDNNNNVHVVWEQQQGAGGSVISYARRNAGAATWSAPVVITNHADDPSNKFFKQPEIIATGTHLYVSYVFVPTESQQRVYLKQCQINQGCTEATDWAAGKNISGPFLNVNNNAPFTVINKLAYDGATNILHAYYHGFYGSQLPNERLWTVDSCNSENWTVQNSDRVDLNQFEEIRDANPSVIVANDTAYLTYEAIDVNGQYRIYYSQGALQCGDGNGGDNGVYLPLITK